MDKIEIVKIGHIEFRKDCAKGMSITQFKESFKHKNFDSLDKEKAFVILGGVIKESKKKKDDK